MNPLLNNEQGMTELIFAHRNKAYGAYQIRSHYGETTLKSPASKVGFVLLPSLINVGVIEVAKAISEFIFNG